MRRYLGCPCALVLLLAACNDGPVDASVMVDTSESGSVEDTDADPDLGPGGDLASPDPVGCTVDPSAEASKRPGLQPDGSVVLVNGRATVSAGPGVWLEGLAADVAVHPTVEVAYVATAGRNERHLYVIDRATQAIVQDLDRGRGFHGMALSPDGSRLYLSNGVPGGIDVYAVDAAGLAEFVAEIPVAGWTAGMALSPDGGTLWVASFDANRVTEVDTASQTISKTFALGFGAFDLLQLPGRSELWATELAGDRVAIYDLAAESVAATLSLPSSPTMMAADADEDRVFVSVSGADALATIDTATRELVSTVPVAEHDFVDAMGEPLPHSNPGALAYDPLSERLYVARGSDSAVAVFDAPTATLLGSIPTGWYPSALALSPDDGQLVVAEARANGSRSRLVPDSLEYRGGASFISLTGLDLVDTTNTVVESFRRPLDNAAVPDCGDDFPVPLDYAGSPVIEHVILIVNENKTFDALFGDLGPSLGVEADPEFLEWDPATTVNKRALAHEFVIADNFYTDAEESDTGHVFLTATHWTEYVERIHEDRDEYKVLGFYPTSEPAIPDRGNFFAWLVDHGKSLQIYGEIVGITTESSQGPIAQFADPSYPGGLIINYDVPDATKAAYVAEKIAAGELAEFTYLSLPNDHTQGVQPGFPTPPSMVADNDYAVGLIVDAVSHSPAWSKTVIFVLEDDPQGSNDHVDESRSPLLVISPWVRRGYVSHAHYSFPAVFATIERLLGVPPLGRPDASAAPMFDLFTDVPDPTPFVARPREYPEELGQLGDPGVAATRCMDFRGPDRNPGLGVVTSHYLAYRRGELSAAEADARITTAMAEPSMAHWTEEEAEEEASAHAQALAEYAELAARFGWSAIQVPQRLAPAPGCARGEDDVGDDD